MLEALKNVFRRKGRTALTVFGITIGIFALVVMGAMAEKMDLLVDGGLKYYGDKVTVAGEGGVMGFGAAPLTIDKAKEIEKVEGVELAAATVGTTLNKSMDAVSFGPPASINAGDPRSEELESFKISFAQGRNLNPGERGKVVVGSDLVKKLNAKIGQEVTVRDKKYEVVGIWDKTFTAPDSAVGMALEDAQEIIYSDLPEIIKGQVDPKKIVSGFAVYLKPGYDPEEVAKKINDSVPGVVATGPKTFKEQIVNQVAIFNNILYGIGLISLLVGSLSVINTMTMSISERTKEIGVKKAVGARTRHIMTEYLTEAGIIGFLGGAFGVGFGALLVGAINRAMEDGGNKIFLLTPRLMIGSFLFSVVLGILAGILPARHAVKINIVKAVREG